MKKHELCCIGHITHDKIVTPRKTAHMPGGTSYYFSHAIRQFDDIVWGRRICTWWMNCAGWAFR